jgi:enoyl-CoA hydratase/carnithine racemase
MNYKYLNIRIQDQVGWIEYNRPPINSFNWEMLREVPAALDDLLNQPQVRVVVFVSANKKYFSTGADLKVFEEGLKMEYETAVKLSETKDVSEGIRAFLEKRKPNWE